ncbi:hypothetical protein J2Z23_000173 [Lederbergia galactosidilyticus]|uniref:hypothetical protein n=1 Tax=Lederbergia galactosidilytica TaxID=217031 RepID=UPI001AE5E6D3|nr:hypothetical protein [Lederbergia galactosidilytica]MBP1913241.1 hypothetical protein [Lederbergia galactosidilytica]
MITIDFRIYSRATKGGGAFIKSSTVQSKSTKSGGGVVKSSGAGGGTTVTSSAGGGTSTSTAAGGGSTQTSSAGGGTSTTSGFSAPGFYKLSSVPYNVGGLPEYKDHQHAIEITNQLNHSHTVSIGSHTHTTQVPSHTHSFTVKDHSHSISLNPHTHEINLSPHAHDFEVTIPEINIPEHVHEVEHGIFKLDRTPTKVTIKVDGNTVPHTAPSGDSIDLIPYLELDSENRVKRGWHTVEITPNDLGRINAQLMTQFFMQSRGGVDV